MMLTSCGSSEAKELSVLKMAYLPSEEDVERRMKAFNELADYLTEEIGIPVELYRTAGYGPIIEAMRSRKIDFGQSGGSFTYMIAHEKAGVEAVVVRGTSKGRGIYSSIIVTSPSTGIKSIEDVKARQSELVFAFVDPASTSGHLVPRAGLQSMDIDPEGFKRLIYTMNHTNSAMTLMSAKVDVGAISRSTFDRMIEAGRLKEEDLVVLWESAPIPNSPIVVRPDLPQDIKERIAAAFLKLNEGGPLLETMREQTGVEDLIYYPANDAMWDPVREIAYNIDMKLLSPP